MRKIEFRAWNTIVNRYSDAVSISDIYYTENVQFKNLIFEQSTGLKDRDGVGIFEGDILEGNIFVAFLDGSFKSTYKDDTQNGNLLTQKRCEYIKIVGNIHQNPELLKS